MAQIWIARAKSASETNSSGLCAWAMPPGPKRQPGISCCAYQARSLAAENPLISGCTPACLRALHKQLDEGMIGRGLESREGHMAQAPGELRRMFAQPLVGLADRVNERLEVCFHLLAGLVRVIPDVVFDSAVIRHGSGIIDHVELTVLTAAGAGDEDGRQKRIIPGRKERVRLAIYPLTFQFLDSGNEFHPFFHGIDAGAVFAWSQVAPAAAGVGLATLDLDTQVFQDRPPLG